MTDYQCGAKLDFMSVDPLLFSLASHLICLIKDCLRWPGVSYLLQPSCKEKLCGETEVLNQQVQMKYKPGSRLYLHAHL